MNALASLFPSRHRLAIQHAKAIVADPDAIVDGALLYNGREIALATALVEATEEIADPVCCDPSAHVLLDAIYKFCDARRHIIYCDQIADQITGWNGEAA